MERELIARLSAEVSQLRQQVETLHRELEVARAERAAPASGMSFVPIQERTLTAERIAQLNREPTDVIGFLQSDGTFIDLFGPLEAIVGIEPKELVGHCASENVHPDDLEVLSRVLERSLQTPFSICTEECCLRHRNNRWVPVEVTLVNLLDVPAVAAVVFCCRDIAERKRLQSERDALEAQLHQARKLEAVGRLAGGVAHDFNNLLTAIVGNVELARSGADSAAAVDEHLDEVAKAAKRATELTKQLLAFSRHQFVAPKNVSVNRLLTGLERLLRRVIREDIELHLDLRATADSVCIDPGQLEQVVVNLAVNARDAMPSGGNLVIETAGIELDDTFRCSHLETPPGRYVMLTVSDTGQGIPSDVQPHIFEPFFTTKALAEGTGLGLATVYGIVKQASGGIVVYTEAGLGTTFRVYLPISKRAVSDSTRESDWPEPMREGHETVLLVEDDSAVRSVAIKFLERLGYTVHAFEMAPEALAFVRNAPGAVQLLLTDVVMPRMNGRELAEQIYALNPKIQTVFVSGYAEALFAQQNTMAIPFAFLAKPYSMNGLGRKLREVLDGGS